jgi:hypothetical protein
MNSHLIKEFENHLHQVLGLTVEAKLWPIADQIPFYLRDFYIFYEIRLLGEPYLVMAPKSDEDLAPAMVRKQMNQIQQTWQGQCIYLIRVVSPHIRKRLIEQRVPFVVPGNQVYLPDLGIDLREHFRKLATGEKSLSPATEALVIHAIMKRMDAKVTPTSLACEFGYTIMTMTRAINELADTQLVEVGKLGQERWLRFPDDKKAFWEKIQPQLRSPIKKRLWIPASVQNKERLVEAGLTALAHYSMLNPPSQMVYATTAEAWKELTHAGVKEHPISEKEDCELEIWSYDPALMAQNGFADPFSVFLSLRESKDERVQSALAEMMEKIKW